MHAKFSQECPGPSCCPMSSPLRTSPKNGSEVQASQAIGQGFDRVGFLCGTAYLLCQMPPFSRSAICSARRPKPWESWPNHVQKALGHAGSLNFGIPQQLRVWRRPRVRPSHVDDSTTGPRLQAGRTFVLRTGRAGTQRRSHGQRALTTQEVQLDQEVCSVRSVR